MSEVTDEVKVSIIVPVYNTEKYLRQCLDSILSQTLKEIEVICVNDGSTDSSGEILEEYRRLDERVKVITKKNDGLGAARNSGIDAAKGEYIGFVDSDDFVDPNMFSRLYWTGLQANADVSIGNVYLYLNDSQQVMPYRNQALYQKLEKMNFFRSVEIPQIVTNIGVWDRIYRKEFLCVYNLRNPEHVIYEDALFSFQTSILANKITVCCDAIYFYRKNTGTAITDKEIEDDSFKFDFLKNCINIKKFLYSQNMYDIFADYYLVYFLSNALWHQSNISEYGNFKSFFFNARQLLEKSDWILILYSHLLSWKCYVYTGLLMAKSSRICYSIFFYKRIKRKRSQNHG